MRARNGKRAPQCREGSLPAPQSSNTHPPPPPPPPLLSPQLFVAAKQTRRWQPTGSHCPRRRRPSPTRAIAPVAPRPSEIRSRSQKRPLRGPSPTQPPPSARPLRFLQPVRSPCSQRATAARAICLLLQDGGACVRCARGGVGARGLCAGCALHVQERQQGVRVCP